jgi:hypothetical protein
MAKKAAANSKNSPPLTRAGVPGQRYTDTELADGLRKAKGLITVAAQLIGCDTKTLRTRLDKSEDLRQIQLDAREGIIDLAELALEKAIRNGESWAVAFTLKTIGKQRGYVERQEHTGADGGPMVMSIAELMQGGGDDNR